MLVCLSFLPSAHFAARFSQSFEGFFDQKQCGWLAQSSIHTTLHASLGLESVPLTKCSKSDRILLVLLFYFLF